MISTPQKVQLDSLPCSSTRHRWPKLDDEVRQSARLRHKRFSLSSKHGSPGQIDAGTHYSNQLTIELDILWLCWPGDRTQTDCYCLKVWHRQEHEHVTPHGAVWYGRRVTVTTVVVWTTGLPSWLFCSILWQSSSLAWLLSSCRCTCRQSREYGCHCPPSPFRFHWPCLKVGH